MTNENPKNTGRSKKMMITLVIIGAVAAVSAVACGHGQGMSPKMMKRMFLGQVDDVMDDIDATDTQRATFEATADEILNDAMAMKQAHKEGHKEIVAILSAPTPDRDALKAHIQDHIDEMEKFALRTADKVLDAYETLSPEQREILLEKLANHAENH